MNVYRKAMASAFCLVCMLGVIAVAEAQTAPPGSPADGLVLIPAGEFEMGDHHGFRDPKHGGDETPVHRVRLDAYYMAIYDVTTREYCAFLNESLSGHGLEVRNGGVYLSGGGDLLCETRTMSPYSRIGWDGTLFSVLDGKDAHPVICIRWAGAAAYCNWLSAQRQLPTCYDISTWNCDFTKSGFRLPTEAEWEYAARGGQQNPYYNFPWGDEPDPSKANWPESSNPFRTGPEPWTTPVGFFDGRMHERDEFNWPGTDARFQTSNGVNGFGLYDMAGNVWQFVNDWYGRDYYGNSPTENPVGPEQGSLMPDGKPYRGMRGGNWYNGESGHSRVSNRNPSYWRGPQDPNHPYYHVGFRVVRSADAKGQRLASNPPPQSDIQQTTRDAGFTLRSPEVADGESLPAEFTGDGSGATLPLTWSGAPEGTKSYAVIMHHVAPDMTKWYWILYDIPASVKSLAKNTSGVGTLGTNSVNERLGYAPPHSKGPGPKAYIYTVYALSEAPQIGVTPDRLTRDDLLAAMRDRILATAELRVIYTRPGEAAEPGRAEGQPGPPRHWWDWRGWWNGQAPPPPPPPQAKRENRPQEPVVPALENTGQSVGLFSNTPGAFAGYTLFAPKHNTMTYLLDNSGKAVHAWTQSEYEPGQTVYLLENGHLLRCCFTHARGFTQGGEGGRLEEYDWDGNLVWEFDYATDTHMLHHDIRVLPNGNILALAVERRTYEACLAAGFEGRMLRDRELFPDYVIEIQPTRPSGGSIVWEWHVWDHLVQEGDSSKAHYGNVAAHPERIDVNCNGRPAPAFWNHMNAIDYNPALDQILLSVRGCNEIWVVDHSTTASEAKEHSGGRRGKGGDLLYRWGNPMAYQTGTAQDRQLFDQHDAQWIPNGCPGAGNILVFNNGLERGYSSVEEIVPPVDSAGAYVLSAGRACDPVRPVWHYEAQERTRFFSAEISGAQRLPNGNTLICEGVHGTFFEVTPAGETVWRYVNPVIGIGPLAQGEVPPKDHRGHGMNAVFKVHRYGMDYPAFAGKPLNSGEVLERPASERRSQAELEALPGAQGPPGPGKKSKEGMSPEVIRSLGYL